MGSSSEQVESKHRNFICSCGKAYLSYAALFTHIKQKHNGKAPGEIIRPRSQNKRGRPRKSQKPSNDKPRPNPTNNGYFADNINSKNINFDDHRLNIAPKQSPFQEFSIRDGFQSFRNDKQKPLSRTSSERADHTYLPPQQNPQNQQAPSERLNLTEQEENLPNQQNELSTNTLAFATIIINLQQLMDQHDIKEAREKDLSLWRSYHELKRFYEKTIESKKQGNQENQNIFVIGHIICNFLNFCQNILEVKAKYDQILMFALLLIQFLIEKKGASVLRRCEKDVIQEYLPSFCQQYLSKCQNDGFKKIFMKHWLFRRRNAYKVLGIFMHWLTAVDAQKAKNEQTKNQNADQKQQKQQQGAHPSDDKKRLFTSEGLDSNQADISSSHQESQSKQQVKPQQAPSEGHAPEEDLSLQGSPGEENEFAEDQEEVEADLGNVVNEELEACCQK